MPTGLWLPENLSSYGGEIDRLFYIILWVTGVVFVGVETFLLWCLVAYRRRPGRRAHYTHGNTAVEVVWTAVPAVILVWIGLASKATWSRIRERPPEDPYVVEVTGRQFNWIVKYSGPDRAFGTADDFELTNELHIPAHRKVLVRLTTQDVIHSLFIPYFRTKTDAVPGLVTQMWFDASRPTAEDEVLEMACAELCGLGHTTMRGIVKIHEPEAFEAWLAEMGGGE